MGHCKQHGPWDCTQYCRCLSDSSTTRGSVILPLACALPNGSPRTKDECPQDLSRSGAQGVCYDAGAPDCHSQTMSVCQCLSEENGHLDAKPVVLAVLILYVHCLLESSQCPPAASELTPDCTLQILTFQLLARCWSDVLPL